MNTIIQIIKDSVMITSFVMVMMLIIEYINVRSEGKWSKPLQKNGFLQIIIASVLGIIPGCLGTYTVVSLFTHNLVGFGALVAVMIATAGDEAFVMFSMIPETALIITAVSFGIAVTTGLIINLFVKNKKFNAFKSYKFPLHEEECCKGSNTINLKENFRKISFPRAILIFGLLVFIFGLFSSQLGHHHQHDHLKAMPTVTNHEIHAQTNLHHDHAEAVAQTKETHHSDEDSKWNWINITFLITSGVALLIVILVPNHFLQEHLWGHVIKGHFLKIFLWTLGALAFISILMNYINLNEWVDNNKYFLLILAVLIGLIPESGPHLIFVTLFFNGSIPLGILLANSIVQDGHGSLPLFAESKKSFLVMKAINMLVGLIVGFLSLWMV